MAFISFIFLGGAGNRFSLLLRGSVADSYVRLFCKVYKQHKRGQYKNLAEEYH